MFKYFSMVCLLMTAHIALSMDESKKSEEPTKSADSSMTQIKSWKDVAPFAGKVVAYKATEYYLSKSPEHAYPVDSDTSLIYGYVKEKPKKVNVMRSLKRETGYSIARLLKSQGVASSCFFLDTFIKESAVQMRCATSEEINKIAEAIQFKKAEFEYDFFFEKKLKAALLQ